MVLGTRSTAIVLAAAIALESCSGTIPSRVAAPYAESADTSPAVAAPAPQPPAAAAAPMPQEEQSAPLRWPWFVGGALIGVVVGFAILIGVTVAVFEAASD